MNKAGAGPALPPKVKDAGVNGFLAGSTLLKMLGLVAGADAEEGATA